MQFLQKIQGLNPEERKKELRAYRPKAQEKLAAVLKETLSEGQRSASASWSCNGRGFGTGRSGKTCKSRTSNGSNSWR